MLEIAGPEQIRQDVALAGAQVPAQLVEVPALGVGFGGDDLLVLGEDERISKASSEHMLGMGQVHLRRVTEVGCAQRWKAEAV